MTQFQHKGDAVTEFLFPLPSPAAAPIRGRAERFPSVASLRRPQLRGARGRWGLPRPRGAVLSRGRPNTMPSGRHRLSAGTSNYHYEMELSSPSARQDFAFRSAGARTRSATPAG
jgi:hypothetical protein